MLLFLANKKDISMKKVCSYCGRIHEKKYICQAKKMAIKTRQEKPAGEKRHRFRSSGAWKKKAEQIKRRDNYLCQACIRQMSGTDLRYNTHALSVHHITGLKDNYDKRLDDDNLITLCRMHHDMAEHGELTAEALRRAAIEQQSRGCVWGG